MVPDRIAVILAFIMEGEKGWKSIAAYETKARSTMRYNPMQCPVFYSELNGKVQRHSNYMRSWCSIQDRDIVDNSLKARRQVTRGDPSFHKR